MQESLVLIAVLGAVFYLGRKTYFRFFKIETKCDGCSINKTSQQN